MRLSVDYLTKIKTLFCIFLLCSVLSVEAKEDKQFSNNTCQSIFYVNDVHGQLPTMIKIVNALTQYEAKVGNKDNIDSFIFSAGDIYIGSDSDNRKIAGTFLNLLNTQATAIGNHEFDMGYQNLSEALKNVKAVKVAANAKTPDNNPLKEQIIKSIIIYGKSGEKYGIIGAQSPTLIERMKDKSLFGGIVISGGEEAYKELQQEVDKLRNEGINKIIMLSHSGYEEEKEFAKHISGVDVIIGGHSHDLIFDITEGNNLQYSPCGEPVVITQAGRDGKNFGILNIEYNKDGVIVKAQNNVYKTDLFGKSSIMTTAVNVLLGKSPVVANIQSTETLTDRMNVEENPYIDVFMDMVREQTGADVVLVNSANFRGKLDVGKITERDISGIFPFKNSMCIVEITEKNLIDALNHGGKSLLAPDLKPSFIQVSGLKYTLSKKGDVVQAAILKSDGNCEEIDVKNPSKDRIIKAAYDDYLLNGGDGFVSLKDVKVLKKYDYDKDAIIIKYLQDKKELKPLVIKRDKRIIVK